jgi:hypothetical protein
MKLDVEGRSPINNVSEAKVRSVIARLRSYGPSSFASLTDESGNYLQVAGGGATCMMERRDVSGGRHYRAFQNNRSVTFADGTALVFGGGKVKLASNEWFVSQDVEDAFLAFLRGEHLPSRVKWRDITDLFR